MEADASAASDAVDTRRGSYNTQRPGVLVKRLPSSHECRGCWSLFPAGTLGGKYLTRCIVFISFLFSYQFTSILAGPREHTLLQLGQECAFKRY